MLPNGINNRLTGDAITVHALLPTTHTGFNFCVRAYDAGCSQCRVASKYLRYLSSPLHIIRMSCISDYNRMHLPATAQRGLPGLLASLRKTTQDVKAYRHHVEHCADGTVTNHTADLGDIQTYKMECTCIVDGHKQYCGTSGGKELILERTLNAWGKGPAFTITDATNGTIWFPLSYPDKQRTYEGLGLPDWWETNPKGMPGGYESVWDWWTPDARSPQTMRVGIYARDLATLVDTYGPLVDNRGTIELTWQLAPS